MNRNKILIVLLIAVCITIIGCSPKNKPAEEGLKDYFYNPLENSEDLVGVAVELLKDMELSMNNINLIMDMMDTSDINVISYDDSKEVVKELRSIEEYKDIRGIAKGIVDIKYCDIYQLMVDLKQTKNMVDITEMDNEKANQLYEKQIREGNYIKNRTMDAPVVKYRKVIKVINENIDNMESAQDVFFGYIRKYNHEVQTGVDHVKSINNKIKLDKPNTNLPQMNEVELEEHRKVESFSIHDVDPSKWNYVPPTNITDKENWFGDKSVHDLGDDYKEGMYEDPSLYIVD